MRSFLLVIWFVVAVFVKFNTVESVQPLLLHVSQNRFSKQSTYNEKEKHHRDNRDYKSTCEPRWLHCRGGASSNFNIHDALKGNTPKPFDISSSTEGQKNNFSGTTNVLVSTSFGSMFLDKRKKLVIAKNETVLDLKVQLSTKFPGSPPMELQNLYFSSRLLNDSECIGNITSISPVPLMLDTISGTSVYNKSMSVRQALEAYVATIAQQTYLGAKLQQLYHPSNPADTSTTTGVNTNRNSNGVVSPTMDMSYYKELFNSINASIYERYAVDIEQALLAEQEPETISADTSAWRSRINTEGNDDQLMESGEDGSGGDGVALNHGLNPLTAALAKEFDLNWRGLFNFSYYSVVMAVRHLKPELFYHFELFVQAFVI